MERARSVTAAWGGAGEGERGAVLVEFSFVFVLFVFICYALVAFGLAMNLKSNLTHAASEGARAAIGAGGQCDVTQTACHDQKVNAAIARVNEAVGGQSTEVKNEVAAKTADPANVSIAYCDGVAAPYCIFVSIPYDYGAHPIVPNAPGLGVVVPSTLRASAVVQITN